MQKAVSGGSWPQRLLYFYGTEKTYLSNYLPMTITFNSHIDKNIEVEKNYVEKN